jgi:hypothetical protein
MTSYMEYPRCAGALDAYFECFGSHSETCDPGPSAPCNSTLDAMTACLGARDE